MSGSNKAILDLLYPTVDKQLSSPASEKVMLQVIGKFIDKNADLLSTSGPCYRITISDKEKNDFYSSIGLTEVGIKQALKSSNYIKTSWSIMMNPFYTACATVIRHYILKRKLDKINTISFYLCIGMYPLIHHKYFKYNCNENIMNYTISHLSNKYKYKQLKSLYAALQDLSTVCTKTHESRLKVGNDIDFTKYINDMHARLNDNLKNVAIEYYKNHESGNYLNVESDNIDEDDYHEADNSSYAVERICNNVTTKIAMNGPSIKISSISARMCDVSVNEFRNICYKITNEDHIHEFKSMVGFLTQIFIFDLHNQAEMIKSRNYILSMLEVYKKTNNKDTNIVNMRKILDKWLVDSGITKRIKRAATLNDFKKAMYIFVVLTIQDNM